MIDWLNISYLQTGNEKQQKSYRILTETEIMSVLKGYDPILVGTIPIGIDIDSSDLDIICNVIDFERFRKLVVENFSKYDCFTDRLEDVYVASFKCQEMEIEIYATKQLTVLQNAYRHMLVEDRILRMTYPNFRKAIIKLKSEGFKTEPAFGELLNLKNPYSDLLELERLTDKELLLYLRTHL